MYYIDLQKLYSAGTIFKLKNVNISFFLIRINWYKNEIKYRKLYTFTEEFYYYATIDDIKMSNKAYITWRNYKIDKLLE